MLFLKNLKYAFLYITIFFLLFIQFPISGSLPQNNDTWLNLYSFQHFYNSIFQVEDFYFMYPFENGFNMIDPTWGGATIFNLINIFFNNHLWSYFIYISIVYAMNGFSAFLIFRIFFKNSFLSFIGGLLFSLSNYSIALIDNQNAIFISPVLFSAYYYLLFAENRKYKYYIFSIITGGLSIYFCSYSALYSLIFIFYFHLLAFKNDSFFKSLKFLFGYFFTVFLFLIPLLIYVYNPNVISFQENISSIEMTSLRFIDFFRVVRGNLLIEPLKDINNEWLYNTKAVYTSCFMFLFGLIFIIKNFNEYYVKLLSVMFFTCFILAIGPKINIFDIEVNLPQYYLYKVFPSFLFFRNPIRIYLFCIFILCLFTVGWWTALLNRLSKNTFIFLFSIFLIIYAIENIAIPFVKFSSNNYLFLPDGINFVLNQNKDRRKVIVHFPSRISFNEFSSSDLNPINREYIYTYWSTIGHYNSINGYAANYLPLRSQTDTMLNNINNLEDLNHLIKERNVNYIIHHKDMHLLGDKVPDSIFALSQQLKVVFKDECTIVYQKIDQLDF